MEESKQDQQIGYILRSYPRLSQTFILNEILALEEMGMSIEVFAITDPQEDIVQPQARKVKACVNYLDWEGRRNARPTVIERRRTIRSLGYRYQQTMHYVVGNETIDQGYTASNRMECFYQAVHLVQLLDLQRRRTGKTVSHLHAHFAHDPALIAQLVHMLTGIPYSFTAHARDLYQVPQPVLAERIHLARNVITCCHTNLDYLSQVAPGEREKFSLIYHGVNLEGFHPAEGEPEIQDVPLLLSVGRLVEKKGFFHLLEALLRVKEQGLRFRCEIYGEGPLQGELEAWIASHGMAEEVHLAGSCTQEELIPIYQRAALFLLTPSVTEDGDRDGIPNSLAEAMAVGLPVITCAVGGIPELVTHGETGLIYEPGDAPGIAAGIAGLLADESRRNSLGSAARRRVSEQFDIAQAARSLQELFSRHNPLPAAAVPEPVFGQAV